MYDLETELGGKASQSTVDDISTNVAYINATDNETITDTEVESSSISVDTYLSITSTNPVQNKVITQEINRLSEEIEDISTNLKLTVVDDGNGNITIE